MRKLLIITASVFMSVSLTMAQNQLKIALKDSTIMDFYVDGKKVEYELARLLDSNKLASVTILNDEASLEKYNAKVGVVWIESAQTESILIGELGVRIVKDGNGTDNDKEGVVILSKFKSDKNPFFIIDGKKVEKGEVIKLDPKEIKNISVLKGKSAKKMYGDGASNGVVIITTNAPIKKGKG